MTNFDEVKQKKKIDLLKRKEEEEVTQMLSEKYGIPYSDLSKMTIDLDYLKIIDEDESRNAKMAIFQGVGKKIQIAVQNPSLELTQNILKKLEEQYSIQTFLVSLSGLKETWEKYKEVPEFIELSKGTVNISAEKITELLEKDMTPEELKNIFLESINNKKNRSVTELIEIVLGGALNMEASDVHIEPQEKNIKLRFRFDGVLHDVLEFNPQVYNLLVSRIKLISEMKLNIKDKAQDGRFSIKAGGLSIEIRSSILPSPNGESIVLRVLNPKTINVAFDELGMHPKLQEIVRKEIKKPNGLILTTGPTGSGKTTTLYTFLKELSTPKNKTITIEEPIEYHLSGIVQTQTKPDLGYTFSTGLKAVLRQDPDIIMVGEIRDKETASIAVNAALTGHLVLSTLHTNDAAGTIPRLIELEVRPNTIAPAVNISLAQRLVRKLCEHCKKEYKPTVDEIKIL
ncbi:GspE/PulE family protein, partial [Patescibacteria group bacterium]